MMKKTVMTIAALFVISSMVLIPVLGGSAEAASDDFPLTVTDSRGKNITFTEPAQSVASLGVSFTATLLELGCIDNIVMMDSNSVTSNSGIIELESFPASMVFTVSSINANNIVQNLMACGDFVKERDVVFIYGYSYLMTSVILGLEDAGFKVVTFYPLSYEDSISMTADIGAIMGKTDRTAEITGAMRSIAEDYPEALIASGINESTKVKAIYVSYSGTTPEGKVRVGNLNSYSVILMKIAGGVNPLDNSANSATTYDVDISVFIQQPMDVIFVDPYYPGTVADFRAHYDGIPDQVLIYKLPSKLMNQYGPTSMNCIEYMAMAMYPDIFGSLDEEQGSVEADNTLIYVAAAVTVMSVLAVAYVVFRR